MKAPASRSNGKASGARAPAKRAAGVPLRTVLSAPSLKPAVTEYGCLAAAHCCLRALHVGARVLEMLSPEN